MIVNCDSSIFVSRSESHCVHRSLQKTYLDAFVCNKEKLRSFSQILPLADRFSGRLASVMRFYLAETSSRCLCKREYTNFTWSPKTGERGLDASWLEFSAVLLHARLSFLRSAAFKPMFAILMQVFPRDNGVQPREGDAQLQRNPPGQCQWHLGDCQSLGS